MGVSGLSQYLKDLAAYQNVNLSIECGPPEPFRFVVDGMSLCHHLRRLAKKIPCIYYLKYFEIECIKFLNIFEQFGIQISCVVFDGTFERIKDTTRATRRSARQSKLFNLMNKIEQLNNMAQSQNDPISLVEISGYDDCSSIQPYRQILIHVLKSSKIEVSAKVAPKRLRISKILTDLILNVQLTGFGEADQLTASICKERNLSAVLAEDSDYFLFGIPYVPISSLSLETELTSGSPSEFNFMLFTPDSVQKHLKIDPSLYPFVSVLTGSDYTTPKFLEKFHRAASFPLALGTSSQRLHRVLSWISRTKDVRASLGRIYQTKKKRAGPEIALIEKIVQQFQTPPVSKLVDIEHQEQSLNQFDSDKVSQILKLHMSGAIPPFVLGILSRKRFWIPLSPFYTCEELTSELRYTLYHSLLSISHTETTFELVEIKTGETILSVDTEATTPIALDWSGSISLNFIEMITEKLGIIISEPQILMEALDRGAGDFLFLLTLIYLQHHGKTLFTEINYKSIADALIDQFYAINTCEPSFLAQKAAVSLPSPIILQVSAAFVFISDLMRIICGLTEVSPCLLFDGLIFCKAILGQLWDSAPSAVLALKTRWHCLYSSN